MSPIVKSFLSVSAVYLLGEPREHASERGSLGSGNRDVRPMQSSKQPAQGSGLARRTGAAPASIWIKRRSF